MSASGSAPIRTVYTQKTVDSFLPPKQASFDPRQGKSTVIFVRHAHTQSNADRLFGGRTIHSPVTELGYQQCDETGKILSEKVSRIDYIMVSPMKRTTETAFRIIENFPVYPGFDCVEDERLHERDAGEYEGKHLDLYAEVNVYDKKTSANSQLTFEEKMAFTPGKGVESYASVWARTSESVNEACAKLQNKVILVVVDSGVFRSVYWHLAAKRGFFTPYDNFKPANGSAMTVTVDNGQWSLEELYKVDIIPSKNIVRDKELIETFFKFKRDDYTPLDDETIFIFARHGENLANVERKYDGRTLNMLLTPAGHVQGQKAGKKIADKVSRIDHVVVSPMIRTRETAEEILKAFEPAEREFVVDARFNERNAGHFEGGYLTALEPTNKEDKKTSADPDISFTDTMSFSPHEEIESYGSIWSRTRPSILEMSSSLKGRVILVVTHSGTMRSLFWHMAQQLGVFVPYANFKPKNGAFLVASVKNEKTTLHEMVDIEIL